MRLLILGLLGYVCYRVLKSRVAAGSMRERSAPTPDRIDDVMVQDPYCKIYLPRRQAVRAVINGRDCYFCSTRCRDAYAAGFDGEATQTQQQRSSAGGEQR